LQGYILNVTRVRDEDLIVSVLSQNTLHTLYRFYGARHSQINIGYKIDFEVEYQLQYLPKLRNILHLGSPWLKDLGKMQAWQSFIKILYAHLKEAEEIEGFYFQLLEDLNRRFTKQNPKRALIEGYVKLLDHEGRLQTRNRCFICEEKIDENPVLVRAFLPACQRCIDGFAIRKEALGSLYRYYDSQFLNEAEIEYLYSILLEGV